MKKNLLLLRKKIDKIDASILDLLNKRLLIVRKVGLLKTRIYVKTREHNIISKLKKLNIKKYNENFPNAGIISIFKQIIKFCRRVEKNEL